jgi:hypothetical protein
VKLGQVGGVVGAGEPLQGDARQYVNLAPDLLGQDAELDAVAES